MVERFLGPYTTCRLTFGYASILTSALCTALSAVDKSKLTTKHWQSGIYLCIITWLHYHCVWDIRSWKYSKTYVVQKFWFFRFSAVLLDVFVSGHNASIYYLIRSPGKWPAVTDDHRFAQKRYHSLFGFHGDRRGLYFCVAKLFGHKY